MLVTDTRSLSRLCESLSGAPYVAIDTEFMREKTYWPRLCLVQLAYGEHAAAVDPLAPGLDMTPLRELLVRENVLKVLHSASQDVEVFLGALGVLPRPVFDTQIGAMVCGYGEQAGYATLVQQIAGVSLDKASQITDWSVRPLSERQVSYALADVTHLCAIYEEIARRVEDAGRTPWVSEEMAALSDPENCRVEPREAWRRIRIRTPSRRALAALRELASWRELTAQQRDLPRNWVAKDEALVEIATHAPKTTADLERVRGLRSAAARGKDGKAMLDAVQRALSLPRSEWPEAPERTQPARGQDSLVALMQALLRLRCEEHGVAQKLVATRDDLDAIAMSDDPDREHPELRTLRGWRRELFGADALELKAGRLGITGDGASGIRLMRL